MSGSAVLALARQPAMLRGRIVTPALPTWPAKDPTSTVTRSVDLAGLLGSRTIRAFMAAGSGVTVAGQDLAGSVATLVLQGGVAGTTARVEVRALCSDGTDEVAAILLPIVSTITIQEGEPMAVTLSASGTGLAPVVLGPLPVIAAPGASVSLRGRAVARNAATGDTASWDLAAMVKGIGTLSAAVEQQNVSPYQVDAALAGCTLAVSASGGSIWLVGNGVAGVTLAWSADLDRTIA